MGYDGLFQPKHVSKGAEFNGGLPDGVAIFWNTQRIQKIDEERVFSGSLGQYTKVSKSTGVIEDDTIKQAKQVALAVKLQFIETKDQEATEFLVMTAHVKSGEKPADIPNKKYQGGEVARKIRDEGHNKNLPTIFACDFNNRPGGDAHIAFFKELLCKCPLGVIRKQEMENFEKVEKCRAEEVKNAKTSKDSKKAAKKFKEAAKKFKKAAEKLGQTTKGALKAVKGCSQCDGTGFRYR